MLLFKNKKIIVQHNNCLLIIQKIIVLLKVMKIRLFRTSIGNFLVMKLMWAMKGLGIEKSVFNIIS